LRGYVQFNKYTHTGTHLRESNGQQAGQNPLRMDVTREEEALFDHDPRHKGKALLLDLTIVDPRLA